MADSPHLPGTRRNHPVTAEQMTEVSFVKRHLWTILLGLIFNMSLVILTTMLVLIIQAAISKPPKYINRGYFIGLMLAFGTCFMTIVLLYVKYSERTRQKHKPQGLGIKLVPMNEPELALPPSHPVPRDDIERIQALIDNWQHGHPPERHDLRSILALRHQPSAIAHVAGATNNNHPHLPCPHHHHHHAPHPLSPTHAIELQPLPPAPPQRPAPAIPATARDLQRFLDHELQRQEAIKRRIRNWLQGISTTHDSSTYPPRRDSLVPLPLLKHRTEVPRLMDVPAHRRKGSGASAFSGGLKAERTKADGMGRQGRRIPPDPVRLREIDQEIETYLGIPAPPLRFAHAVPAASECAFGEEQGPRIRAEGLGLRLHERQRDGFDIRPGHSVSFSIGDGEEEEEEGRIDYNYLPPAIPRPGARARDPVPSDPITVVHVGRHPHHHHHHHPSALSDRRPLAPASNALQRNSSITIRPVVASPLGRAQRSGDAGRGDGLHGGEEERVVEIDDFAEKWIEGIMRGVDVMTPSIAAAGRRGAGGVDVMTPSTVAAGRRGAGGVGGRRGDGEVGSSRVGKARREGGGGEVGMRGGGGLHGLERWKGGGWVREWVRGRGWRRLS
ncbi:MAG: hypothetical protein Q9202_006789 [Teloschistes flavicans]